MRRVFQPVAWALVILVFSGHAEAQDVRGTSASFVNPGNFSGQQMNFVVTDLVNGISPLREFQTAQESKTWFTTDSLTAGIAFPVYSKAYQGNAISGYVTSASKKTNVVAGYFQARSLAPGTHMWGINPVFVDGNQPGGTGAAAEFDCNVENPSTTGSCTLIDGKFSTRQESYPAIHIAVAGGGAWSHGLFFEDGAINIAAIQIGAQERSASQPSQVIRFLSRNQHNEQAVSAIFASSSGSLTLIPASNVSIEGGLSANGGGLKHKRVESCATEARVGSNCETVIFWDTPFSDNNYTATCSFSGGPYLAHIANVNQYADSVSAQLVAEAPVAIRGVIQCIGIHD
jgi:hypothetical protein